MTIVEQLESAWPTVNLAASWVELFLCNSTDNTETAWEMMMRAIPPLTLEEVEQIVVGDIDNPECDESTPYIAEVRRQAHLPEFRRYLAGKLGMC